jgi:hypothetical protein
VMFPPPQYANIYFSYCENFEFRPAPGQNITLYHPHHPTLCLIFEQIERPNRLGTRSKVPRLDRR